MITGMAHARAARADKELTDARRDLALMDVAKLLERAEAAMTGGLESPAAAAPGLATHEPRVRAALPEKLDGMRLAAAKRPPRPRRIVPLEMTRSRTERLPRWLRDPARVLARSAAQFVAHDVLTLAAAMAFYTGLALAPLLILLLWAAAFLGSDLQQSLVDEVVSLIGPQGGAAIASLIREAAEETDRRRTAGAIGLTVLFFSSTGVFAQLQSSLNTIWGVESKASGALWHWLRKRLLSFGMLLTLGFLLLVSLFLSATVSWMAQRAGSGTMEAIFNLVTPFLLYVSIFGAIFLWLPDVELTIRDVAQGAVLTAALFTFGKWAIGLYLGMSTIGSAYGAAGTLVVFLVWTYYSCAILFMGAVLTHQVAAARHDGVLVAEEHAAPADIHEQERKKESVSATVVDAPPKE